MGTINYLTTYRFSTTLSPVWRWDGARGVCVCLVRVSLRDLQLRSMVQHGKVALHLLITVTYYVQLLRNSNSFNLYYLIWFSEENWESKCIESILW